MKDETIATRGRRFTGPIKSTRMARTAVFEVERRTYIPKYERYEKRRTRLKVHIPEGMDVHDGDIVVVQETRPISKTKHFTIVENLTQNTDEKGKIQKDRAKPETTRKARKKA